MYKVMFCLSFWFTHLEVRESNFVGFYNYENLTKHFDKKSSRL
jgi:hypothetical protein